MANDDRFRNNSDPTQSGRNGFVPTPSNTEELPHISRQIWVTADGNLSFVFAGYGDEDAPVLADAVGPYAVKAGQLFNYAVRFITEDTTAELLVIY
jgi:hypothetical protein